MVEKSGPSRRANLAELPCFQLYLGWRRAQAFYRPKMEGAANPQRMYVLGLLCERGELGVTELARTMDVDVGTISGLLTRMETEQWVERRRPATSRLQVNIRATRRGRAYYRRKAEELVAADRRLLSALEPRDVQSLQRIVETLSRLVSEPMV